MDHSTVLSAVVLGIVEGLTEYLPVSSTGHMVLVGRAIHFEGDLATTFEIVIQLGAILAVLLLYWRRFYGLLKPEPGNELTGFPGMIRFAASCAPAGIVGLLFGKLIKTHLFSPTTVAVAMIVGGVALIWIERRGKEPEMTTLEHLPVRLAFLLGLFQCLALWAGISRSGSMIFGGMLLGLSRIAAAEYAFIIAVPMMVMATGHELWHSRDLLSMDDLQIFAIGFVVAFAVALASVRVFMQLIRRHSLAAFGYYRILLGVVTLWLLR